MNYVDMIYAIDKRAKEFIKSMEYSNWEYQHTTILNNMIIITIGKSFCSEWCETTFEILPEEFNSENGIQMYIDRLKQEEIEKQKELEKSKKAIEERNKQLRYEMYLQYKKEFENEENNE